MEYRDYYKVLEVQKGADAEAIKKSYRRLARKYHPDFNKGNKLAEHRFKEINEAYQVLGDPEKRKKYDHLGANWNQFKDGPGQGFDASTFMSDFGAFGKGAGAGRKTGFSDFFKTFFGNFDLNQAGDPTARRSRRGGAPETSVEAVISVREAVTGTRKRITLRRETFCLQCRGKGAGLGGAVCPQCGGRGTVLIPETIEVNIPPGVQGGSKVRLKGKGAARSESEPKPDLFLVLRVHDDPVFRLEGRDVHCELPVTATEAVLGAEIDCPTAAGRVRMRIPPETQAGQVFRLKGKGLPALGNHPSGDQIVKIRVLLPRGLTAREKELYQQLAALRRENPRSGL